MLMQLASAVQPQLAAQIQTALAYGRLCSSLADAIAVFVVAAALCTAWTHRLHAVASSDEWIEL